ncbi:MAG: hypothetical protein AABW79_00125 [Nanoarchaeota archaeon]
MNSVFSEGEFDKLREASEKGKASNIENGLAKLSDSAVYLAPVEAIKKDRKTHELLLSYAQAHNPKVEAVAFNPFPHYRRNSLAALGKRILDIDKRLQHLFDIFMMQPHLYLHITPEATNFAVGGYGVGLREIPIAQIREGLACDFIKNCELIRFDDEGARISACEGEIRTQDIYHNKVHPDSLIPWYKAAVNGAVGSQGADSLYPMPLRVLTLDSF